MRRAIVSDIVFILAITAMISLVCLAHDRPDAIGELGFSTYPPPEKMNWNGPEVEISSGSFHSKMGPKLWKIMSSRFDDAPKASSSSLPASINSDENRLHIQVLVKSDDTERVEALISSLDGEVTGIGTAGFAEDFSDSDIRILQGFCPISAMDELALHDSVLYVRLPLKAFMLAERSDMPLPESFDPGLWHDAGFYGAGIKVGVIDCGFVQTPNSDIFIRISPRWTVGGPALSPTIRIRSIVKFVLFPIPQLEKC